MRFASNGRVEIAQQATTGHVGREFIGSGVRDFRLTACLFKDVGFMGV